MGFILFDASGLVKGYTEETGADTIAALFAQRGDHEFVSTPWGYLEAFAVLLRRRNSRIITAQQFTVAVVSLQAEVLNPKTFHLLTVTDANILGATNMVGKHNLNATDAALLTTFVDFVQTVGIVPASLLPLTKG